MADISDVENTLVTLVAGLLGLGTSYAAGSIVSSTAVGASCKVYRGWPERGALDADLANGVTNVSIFPPPAMVRRLPGHLFQWKQSPTVATPTLTVSVSGNVVTFGGTGGANQVAGVCIVTGQNTGVPYAYRLLVDRHAGDGRRGAGRPGHRCERLRGRADDAVGQPHTGRCRRRPASVA